MSVANRIRAGEVTLLTGRGTSVGSSGDIRDLAKGDAVFSGDTVHSGASSYVDLKLTDGGFFLLRPNTRFHIVEFVDHTGAAAAAKAPAAPAVSTLPLLSGISATQSSNQTSHAVFRLIKGGFRSVSGLIGKVNHNEYELATPVATVGIRGTDYLNVICDATCATDPVISGILPIGVNALGGLVATVYRDSILLTTAKGSEVVKEGEYVLVLADGTIVHLPGEPHFLHVDPVPNPANCTE